MRHRFDLLVEDAITALSHHHRVRFHSINPSSPNVQSQVTVGKPVDKKVHNEVVTPPENRKILTNDKGINTEVKNAVNTGVTGTHISDPTTKGLLPQDATYHGQTVQIPGTRHGWTNDEASITAAMGRILSMSNTGSNSDTEAQKATLKKFLTTPAYEGATKAYLANHGPELRAKLDTMSPEDKAFVLDALKAKFGEEALVKCGLIDAPAPVPTSPEPTNDTEDNTKADDKDKAGRVNNHTPANNTPATDPVAPTNPTAPVAPEQPKGPLEHIGDFFKAVWDNPLGKVAIIGAGILLAPMALTGLGAAFSFMGGGLAAAGGGLGALLSGAGAWITGTALPAIGAAASAFIASPIGGGIVGGAIGGGLALGLGHIFSQMGKQEDQPQLPAATTQAPRKLTSGELGQAKENIKKELEASQDKMKTLNDMLAYIQAQAIDEQSKKDLIDALNAFRQQLQTSGSGQ